MEVFVRAKWEALCRRYTSDNVKVMQLWSELEKAYSAKNRHYHNLDHIAYMLELADRYKDQTLSFNLLLFAIFYHDIVYKATQYDNEEKSAELAVERLQGIGMPEADISTVKEMILATKAHQPHRNPTTNLLLDLDLAILGADQERYDRYSTGVRKEYSLYPDLIYMPGRRKVLKHFLHQPNIFNTAACREAFEQKARLNLERELAQYS